MELETDRSLQRELKGIASDLKWSAVELYRIADRLSHAGNDPDAQALRKMITVFHQDEARLEALTTRVDGVQASRLEIEISGERPRR